MRELHSQVREFMEMAGQRVGKEPGDIMMKDVKLGIDLIKEEFDEFIKALEEDGPEQLPTIADALGDLLYVVAWNGLAWGFPMPEVMDEIQRANMQKFGPGSSKNEAGKVQKPPGWTPPDIAGVLSKHR